MPVAPPEADQQPEESAERDGPPSSTGGTTGAAGPGALAASVAADVALAAAGDRVAFERVYRSHVDRVYSVCMRMTADRAQAETLTQDTFVRAWEKLALFRGDSSFATWLHRMAVNVVLNARKSEGRWRRRVVGGGEDESGAAGGGGLGDVAAAVTFAPGEWLDMERAIARLPAGARRIFVLHDVEGYRHEEIGSMLGITAGGSKAQLHRARMLLREALNR